MATWDETNPDDSDVVSDFPANERAARAALITNFGIDHHETEDANVGKHDKVTLLTHVGNPTTGATIGAIYLKDAGGNPELHFKDSANNVMQLTTAGIITNASLPANVAAIGALADPGADRVLFWDETFNTVAWLAPDGTTIAISGTTLAAVAGGINHDALLNYDANQHVDHTTVTLTAGTGLTGGGDISASRTFDVDPSTVDHDLLQNYNADKHVDHTAVVLTAGVGLSGGGDISASRTFDLDSTITLDGLTLTEQAGNPANAANTGKLYTKDTDGITMPFYMDSVGRPLRVAVGQGHANFNLTGDIVLVEDVQVPITWDATPLFGDLTRGTMGVGDGVYTVTATAGTTSVVVRASVQAAVDAVGADEQVTLVLYNGFIGPIAQTVVRNNRGSADIVYAAVETIVELQDGYTLTALIECSGAAAGTVKANDSKTFLCLSEFGN